MNNFQKAVLSDLIGTSSAEADEAFEQFFGDSSTSSEDSAEETQIHASVPNFMEVIDAYSEEDFKSHLRLQRSTLEYLVSNYSQSGISPNLIHRGGRSRIGCRKEVYMYVWYISNTVTYRQLGNLFGVPKSSGWMAVSRVCRWLITVGPQYVKWPQGDDVIENMRLFERKKRIPGVIGVIDFTHIGILAPMENKSCYYNRKQHFSIILQAVVDANKRIIDVCCGEPGSLHDSRVLRRSVLYRKAENNRERLFPGNTFILGDSAYPAMNWLVPPYKDNGRLTDQQKSFNYIHSATRIVVENAFGLNFTEQKSVRTVTDLVVSACVLHNICIIMDDQYHNPEVTEAESTNDFENANGNPIRDPTIDRRQVLGSNRVRLKRSNDVVSTILLLRVTTKKR